MSDLIERLRGDTWVMSCWANSDHLYEGMRKAMDEAADALEAQARRIAELEPQADAYNFACEDMEKFQRERQKAGKEIGTQGSLCDGMSWVYGRLKELEADNARLRSEVFNVIEGWNLPDGARKILEAAYYRDAAKESA